MTAIQRRQQFGLSMIELMVALLLSSFLILGVTQIYIDNKRNYLYQQGQGENQENSRFALMFLNNELLKAGYRRDPRGDITDAFPAETVLSCAFQAGQTVIRADASTLCIRYQPRDAKETDCAGNTFTGSSTLSQPYAETFNNSENIVERITVSDGKLTCQSSSGTGELIEGISAIYFDYGVNDSLDDKAIDKYTATPATTEYVRSLRYLLLFTASANNLSGGIINRLCGDEGDWKKLTGQDFDCVDGKLYQMASGSATIRNLMP